MSDSYKASIRISEIVPNQRNPRKDMGDIDVLAASIEATGGQPIQPLVVVRAGDSYVLVDGERRYHAMQRIGAETCDCLVYANLDEATQAVAMLATDEKLRLDGSGKGRAIQDSFDLGVSDETIAMAAGEEVEHVRRARRTHETKPSGWEQASFDALMLAGEFDDPADQEAVLAAEGGGKSWVTPESVARDIRDRIARTARDEAIRAALPDGIEYRKTDRPYGDAGLREGLLFLEEVSSLKAAEGFSEAHAGEGDLVAFNAYSGMAGYGYAVYSDAHEPIDAEGDPEAAREAEAREARAEHMRKYDASFRRLVDYAFSACWDERGCDAGLESLVRAWRSDNVGMSDGTEAALERVKVTPIGGEETGVLDLYLTQGPVSMYEVVTALDCAYSSSGLLRYWDLGTSPQACEDYAGLYDAMEEDGYLSTAEDRELRAMCSKCASDLEGADDAE